MRGKKAATLTTASSLVVWAIQMLIAGQLYQGAAGMVIAALLFYAYEELQLKQLPTTADDIQGLAEQVGTAARDAVENARSSE